MWLTRRKFISPRTLQKGGTIRVGPGGSDSYIRQAYEGQKNKFFGEQGSHPNLRVFVAMKDILGRPWRSLLLLDDISRGGEDAHAFLQGAGAHGRRSQGTSRRFFSNILLGLCYSSKTSSFSYGKTL